MRQFALALLFTIALISWTVGACVYGFEREINAAPPHFLVAAND